MRRFSIFSLVGQSFRSHKGWPRQWRAASPRPMYDVIIIGGGGHGLATAYYLARNHGITNIAVLEKGWLGGGNTARNTTIVRSNYLWNESMAIYEHSLQLWEGLSQDLNYNLMFSPRGVLNLAHDAGGVREGKRRVHANRLAGVDAQWLSPGEVKAFCPLLDISQRVRYPIWGATLQRRGGTARHDAVAWGFARAADARGIDIIEQCEVTGITIHNGAVTGVETSRGAIRAARVGIVVAGHGSVLAKMAGLRLPIESHPLQAFVSEPVRPVLSCVVMSGGHAHVYVSQSDKGELVIGAGIDAPLGYGQRGALHILEDQAAALCELMPRLGRLRMLRSWGGIVDVCPDASPIIGKTPVRGLYFNGGWGTGGFKATPGSGWCFAHTIACDAPHAMNAPFSLARFETGALIDEHGAAAVAH